MHFYQILCIYYENENPCKPEFVRERQLWVN